MLMPKKDRVAIYEYLFTEGVMVAQKNTMPFNHPKLTNVPNLHVIKAIQSLVSRGYVTERFAWQYYYWYLTNEGIQYLREYLHLPAEIVPSTLKKPVKAETRGARRCTMISLFVYLKLSIINIFKYFFSKFKAEPAQKQSEDQSDRDQYRKAAPEAGGDKKGEAGAGNFEFVSALLLFFSF
jgi:small subunit ribosomal protein S10e